MAEVWRARVQQPSGLQAVINFSTAKELSEWVESHIKEPWKFMGFWSEFDDAYVLLTEGPRIGKVVQPDSDKSLWQVELLDDDGHLKFEVFKNETLRDAWLVYHGWMPGEIPKD